MFDVGRSMFDVRGFNPCNSLMICVHPSVVLFSSWILDFSETRRRGDAEGAEESAEVGGKLNSEMGTTEYAEYTDGVLARYSRPWRGGTVVLSQVSVPF